MDLECPGQAKYSSFYCNPKRQEIKSNRILVNAKAKSKALRIAVINPIACDFSFFIHNSSIVAMGYKVKRQNGFKARRRYRGLIPKYESNDSLKVNIP